jgi:predicted DsbA family dithiol-disulfide isomerase
MSIKIRYATDFVCPNCIAAKVPLMQALEGRDDVEIELLPVELTRPPKERVDTYHDETRRAKWAKDLIPFCESLGMDVHFPPNVVPRPYTTLAWEGYHYAADQGKGEEYSSLMYTAYFTEELDIGDPEVLISLAQRIGLDGDAFRKVLEERTYKEIHEKSLETAKALEVKGVPTIWIGDLRLSGDLFTKEDFTFYLNLAEGGETGSFGSGGFACGPNGC